MAHPPEHLRRAAARLRTAFELHDAGVEMRRETLRRMYPDATEDEVSARVAAWLATRDPEQEFGRPVRCPGG